MTLFEGSFFLSLVAPVLAMIASMCFSGVRGQKVAATCLGIAGLSGVVAGGLGVVQDQAFSVMTPLFFGMSMGFDKFSALFFLPFSLLLVFASLLFLGYTSAYGPVMAWWRYAVLSLGVIFVQWIFLAGNILGFLAAWEGANIAFCLLFMMQNEKKLPPFLASLLGAIMVMFGYFFLSSGALFSDFGTLSYIAAQVEPRMVFLSFIFLVTGFFLPSLFYVFRGLFSTDTRTMGISIYHQQFVRLAVILLGWYGFLRVLLFVFPPLSLEYAFVLLALGAVLTFFSVGRLRQTWRGTVPASLIQCVLMSVMMIVAGGTMSLQILGIFDAMNVALFSLFIVLFLSVCTFVTHEFPPTIIEQGGIFQTDHLLRIRTLALSSALPCMFFVGYWMVGNTLLGVFLLYDELPFRLTLLGILVFLTVLMGTLLASIMRIFFHNIQRNAHQSRTANVWLDIAMVLPMIAGAAFSLGIPRFLEILGAGPLTIAPKTWHGSVVAGAGVLPIAVIGGVIMGGIVVAWVLLKIMKKGRLLVVTAIEDEGQESTTKREENSIRDLLVTRSLLVLWWRKIIEQVFFPVVRLFRRGEAFLTQQESGIFLASWGVLIVTVALTLIVVL